MIHGFGKINDIPPLARSVELYARQELSINSVLILSHFSFLPVKKLDRVLLVLSEPAVKSYASMDFIIIHDKLGMGFLLQTQMF
jgi:hypothetical protein